MADQNKVDDTAFLAHWDAVKHNYGVGEFHAAYHAAYEAWFAAVPAVPAVDALTDIAKKHFGWVAGLGGFDDAVRDFVAEVIATPSTAPADPEQAKLDSLAQAGLAAALENHARQPQAAPEATSEPDEPTDREQLIACLGDDAATLIAQNPDDEMAQTMLDAAAMLEAGEQMGGAQVAKADLDKMEQLARAADTDVAACARFTTTFDPEGVLKLIAMARAAAPTTERKPLTDAWLNENLHSYFSHSDNNGNVMWASVEDILYFARAIEQHLRIGSDK